MVIRCATIHFIKKYKTTIIYFYSLYINRRKIASCFAVLSVLLIDSFFFYSHDISAHLAFTHLIKEPIVLHCLGNYVNYLVVLSELIRRCILFRRIKNLQLYAPTKINLYVGQKHVNKVGNGML